MQTKKGFLSYFCSFDNANTVLLICFFFELLNRIEKSEQQ